MISAALDCSQGCSLAISQNQTLLCSEFLPGSSRESDRLLSQWLLSCCQNLNIEVEEIERWSAGTGPGSFAGLRCGIALLKGICRASQAKMRGVPSCYALAKSVVDPKPGQLLGALHDGRRGQVILTSFLIAESLEPLWHQAPRPLFPEQLLEPAHRCQHWVCQSDWQLPPLPPELQSSLQLEEHLNAAYLLSGEEQWPWPSSKQEQEDSCQPLYVRQAVFVKPTPMR
jgi:tRNA threonylcarbamoyl adenosine modification protein YeaZ